MKNSSDYCNHCLEDKLNKSIKTYCKIQRKINKMNNELIEISKNINKYKKLLENA